MNEKDLNYAAALGKLLEQEDKQQLTLTHYLLEHGIDDLSIPASEVTDLQNGLPQINIKAVTGSALTDSGVPTRPFLRSYNNSFGIPREKEHFYLLLTNRRKK